MRVLALDVGERRIGLATGDTDFNLALPIDAIDRTQEAADVRAVLDAARDRDVEALVVGMPLSMSGKAGLQAASVQLYIDVLAEATQLAIETVDERLTTVEAERRIRETRPGGRKRAGRAQKGDIDSAAATVILQAWMDARRPR